MKFILLFLTFSVTASASGQEQRLVLENQYLKATFRLSPVTPVSLSGFLDKTTGSDLIGEKDKVEPLLVLAGTNFISGNITSSATSSNEKNLIVITQYYQEHELSALMTIGLEPNSRSLRFELSLNQPKSAVVEVIFYPQISGINGINTTAQDDRLVYSKRSFGVLSTDIYRPDNSLTPLTRYPEDGMQFVALYDRQSGFYLFSEDSQYHPKMFIWDGQKIKTLKIVHNCRIDQQQSFSPPFAINLGTFKGSWYDAADIYRRWASKQSWSENRNHNKASWFSKGYPVIHYYNHDFSAKIRMDLPAIKDQSLLYQKMFDSPVITLVHGWERFLNFMPPHYFPPYDGEKAFASFVGDSLKDRNIPFVYISGSAWAISGDLDRQLAELFQKTGKNEAIKRSDNSYEPYDMMEKDTGYRKIRVCPRSSYFRDLIKESIVKLIGYGIPIVQLDEFPQGVFYPCFDPKHPHPPGFGRWLFDSYIDFIKEIRKTASALNPDFVFCAEEMSEIYLPYFDCYVSRDNAPDFNLQTNLHLPEDRTIPLFSYVYHQYLPTFSQFDNSAYGFARAFVRGKLLHFSHMTTLDKDQARLLKTLLKAVQGFANPFIVKGAMRKPLPFDCPEIATKGSPFAGRIEATIPFASPAIHHGVFEYDGKVGCFFVNISKEPVPLDIGLGDLGNNLLEQRIYIDQNLIKILSGKKMTARIKQLIAPFSLYSVVLRYND